MITTATQNPRLNARLGLFSNLAHAKESSIFFVRLQNFGGLKPCLLKVQKGRGFCHKHTYILIIATTGTQVFICVPGVRILSVIMWKDWLLVQSGVGGHQLQATLILLWHFIHNKNKITTWKQKLQANLILPSSFCLWGKSCYGQNISQTTVCLNLYYKPFWLVSCLHQLVY